MKKSSKIFAEIAKKSAESALKRDANTTTCCAIYQPKAPKSLKQFSKIEK
ncbi:MAG: cyclic lactone autoinducer peptide [Eubacterium sp.]